MKTRSQWFLAPSVECSSCGGSLDLPLNEADVSVLTNAILRRSSSGTIGKFYAICESNYVNFQKFSKKNCIYI